MGSVSYYVPYILGILARDSKPVTESAAINPIAEIAIAAIIVGIVLGLPALICKITR